MEMAALSSEGIAGSRRGSSRESPYTFVSSSVSGRSLHSFKTRVYSPSRAAPHKNKGWIRCQSFVGVQSPTVGVQSQGGYIVIPSFHFLTLVSYSV